MIPPPAGVQAQSFASDTHLLSIRFRLCWPDARVLFHPTEPLILNGSEFPEMRISAEKLVSTFACVMARPVGQHGVLNPSVSDLFGIDQAFFGFLMNWSQALERSGIQPQVPTPHDPRIIVAMDLIERTAQPLKQIASAVSLSLSQLDRLFLRHTGYSPQHHRNQRRLQRILFVLRHSEQPIKTIAYSEGFRRISHFSAWFKTQTGLSPRQYRQAHSGIEA